MRFSRSSRENKPNQSSLQWHGFKVCYFSGCSGKPAVTKHRMNPELASFATRLRETISRRESAFGWDFDSLALELFALQFQHNPAYRRVVESRNLASSRVEHWTQIPAVPTAAFKELEFSSLAPAERTAVFHSSGTTEQKPSRHFHCPESLAVYETALWNWFKPNFLGSMTGNQAAEWLFLTPPPSQAPHSSLIHMFEIIRQKMGAQSSAFAGHLDVAGAWMLDYDKVLSILEDSSKLKLILGTAFSFVQLLDYLAANQLRFELPSGSRIMETGGYKNRSRSLPKTELHAFITDRLGVGRENIICEYGMSELSSQAYDSVDGGNGRPFQFPPWARAQIISPETGREVAEGETGLIRILDLANVFSVAAIQTEDLGVRRGNGFELIGRAAAAEARGCSLMTT